MLELIGELLGDSRDRDTAMVVGGVAAAMAGLKGSALAMLGKGAAGLERRWREDKSFKGNLSERWQEAVSAYEETHHDTTNRRIQMVGVPLIVGGGVGLIAIPSYTPPWLVALGAWTAGWGLSLVGQRVYEKGTPVFPEDPLAFLAGPARDLRNVVARRNAKNDDA